MNVGENPLTAAPRPGFHPQERARGSAGSEEVQVPRGHKPVDPSSGIWQMFCPRGGGLFEVSQELVGR